MTEATSGMSRLRNTAISSRNARITTTAMNSGSLSVEHVGEVDVGRGLPADVHDQAGAVLGLRDQVIAQVVHQGDGLLGLRAGGRVDGGEQHLPVR